MTITANLVRSVLEKHASYEWTRQGFGFVRTKIGTVGGAAGQKLAFWNSTPIVQPVLATGASHTVDDIITVLQNLGLTRQS